MTQRISTPVHHGVFTPWPRRPQRPGRNDLDALRELSGGKRDLRTDYSRDRSQHRRHSWLYEDLLN